MGKRFANTLNVKKRRNFAKWQNCPFCKGYQIIEKQIICIKSRKWEQYLWTWRQSVVSNDAPRDFGPEVAFGTKFQIPVASSEGEKCRPLDHMWQIPFIHSVQFVIASNFQIYIKVCRFFLPSGTDTYVLVWWVINNCACAFPKTLSPRLRTIIQVILISILYVLARMVFFQAHSSKKKKTDWPQPGAHL